jgi:hypothetical protein
VKGIANDGLKSLREQHVCIPIEEIAHDRRALFGHLDPSRLNPKRRTCDLYHRPSECGLVARADDPADGTFPPNGSGFRRPTIFEDHDQRRHCSRQWKVGSDDILFRFEENVWAATIWVRTRIASSGFVPERWRAAEAGRGSFHPLSRMAMPWQRDKFFAWRSVGGARRRRQGWPSLLPRRALRRQ